MGHNFREHWISSSLCIQNYAWVLFLSYLHEVKCSWIKGDLWYIYKYSERWCSFFTGRKTHCWSLVCSTQYGSSDGVCDCIYKHFAGSYSAIYRNGKVQSEKRQISGYNYQGRKTTDSNQREKEEGKGEKEAGKVSERNEREREGKEDKPAGEAKDDSEWGEVKGGPCWGGRALGGGVWEDGHFWQNSA